MQELVGWERRANIVFLRIVMIKNIIFSELFNPIYNIDIRLHLVTFSYNSNVEKGHQIGPCPMIRRKKMLTSEDV